MAASFRRIDYSLRPAKYAERKMLCEIFRNLHPFQRIEDYIYVGFGSVWFADFSLFHKALGIKDMVSIEREIAHEKRVLANTPFQISVDFRESRVAIPDLDWERRQLLWLDYDDPLSLDMVLDTAAVATRAIDGTVLSISINCMKAPELAEAQSEKIEDPHAIDAVERLTEKFGRSRISSKISDEDLTGWAYGDLIRTILINEIESALNTRNSSNPDLNMKFKLICEFEYEDGAKMTTLVGIFYEDAEKIDQCGFENLDFMNKGSTKVRIPLPKLTVREFKQLEKQLPIKNGQALDFGEIPANDGQSFAEMYRYLPNYAVIEG
jgi:hypothetical protein